MGKALDDTIITTAEINIEQVVQELAEAGFTGRHNSTKRTTKGNITAEVHRMEWALKLATK